MPSIIRIPRWAVLAILLASTVLALRHLDADFPNHSRFSDDSAKFTDEGWWASGAIHHHLTGKWLLPGDYNPMVAVPLWSVLLEPVFHVTGVEPVAGRAIAFLFTLGTVLVTGALFSRGGHPRLANAAMLLVGLSPLLYFFSRLAILEPALLFFLMAAAWMACAAADSATGETRRHSLWRLVLCGVFMALAMLTKTSALFVAPSIFLLLWWPYREREARAGVVHALVVPVAVFVGLFGLYWLLVMHTHPVDVKVFFRETAPSLSLQSARKAVRILYRCFTWLDPVLVPIFAVVAVWNLRSLRALAKDQLAVFALLFFCGYAGFMVLHFDAAVHYFAMLTVAFPMLVLLLLNALEGARPRAALLLNVAIAISVVANAGYIVRLLWTPQYTLRDASLQIGERIRQQQPENPLMIGHGAIETTLFNQIPALDDLGSLPVAAKIEQYRPGWIVVWNTDLNAVREASSSGRAEVTPVGRYPALDSPDRSALLLFAIKYR